MFKKILFLVLFTQASTSIAGSEDWEGKFDIALPNHTNQTVSHTKTRVQFMFMTAGTCVNLYKGSMINGIKIKKDISMCTNQNIASFTNEVKKLGKITHQAVQKGSTYQD